ncbi:MAG: exonuclease domain-containing protein [Lachnospiraceae bacterium]
MMEWNKGKDRRTYVEDYVVFDLETTGISVAKDEIIEIAAVKVKGHKIVDTFSTFVNPGRPIPSQATRVNGITDAMVAGAPTIEKGVSDFLRFAEKFVLVGHNIRSFDLKFIYQAANQLLNLSVDNDYVDTLPMARSSLPQLTSYKLGVISEFFHIDTQGAHRALNDCMMNQRCFEELGKLAPQVQVQLCPRCGSTLAKRNGKFGAFWGCTGFPDCRFTKNITEG